MIMMVVANFAKKKTRLALFFSSRENNSDDHMTKAKHVSFWHSCKINTRIFLNIQAPRVLVAENLLMIFKLAHSYTIPKTIQKRKAAKFFTRSHEDAKDSFYTEERRKFPIKINRLMDL